MDGWTMSPNEETIHEGPYTIAQAKDYCAEDPKCSGFTFEECKSDHCMDRDKFYTWFKGAHSDPNIVAQVCQYNANQLYGLFSGCVHASLLQLPFRHFKHR
jgi:hypothetical protein